MKFLRIKYFEASTITTDAGQILEFTSKFQKQLRDKDKGGYTALFPTQFHPLIQVLSQILVTPWAESLLQNEIILQELKSLVNKLSYQAQLGKFNSSDLIFILCTIPDLPCKVIFDKKLYNHECLWFKRCLKQSELMLPVY